MIRFRAQRGPFIGFVNVVWGRRICSLGRPVLGRGGMLHPVRGALVSQEACFEALNLSLSRRRRISSFHLPQDLLRDVVDIDRPESDGPSASRPGNSGNLGVVSRPIDGCHVSTEGRPGPGAAPGSGLRPVGRRLWSAAWRAWHTSWGWQIPVLAIVKACDRRRMVSVGARFCALHAEQRGGLAVGGACW